jgi:CHAT domain-containing protein/tetratricopeptide (TPR) repeat protein
VGEQRFQAYVSLIEQLMSCPQGHEEELLRVNVSLVDAGLVAVMGQYARYLENQRDGTAEWLRNFAIKMAQVLELAPASLASDAAMFILEIIRLIAQTKGSLVQVHGFFKANVEKLNESLLLDLPEVFADFIQKIGQSEIDRSKIAIGFGGFGDSIQRFPLGQRWLNLEMGICANQLALKVLTRNAFPEEWAATKNSLANAYRNRIREDPEDNLEQAIAAYQCALQIYTRDAFPEEWAITQNNLAATYCKRIQGGPEDNLEQAIAAYQCALQIYTRDAFPEEWATTQNNLAIAYKNRALLNAGMKSDRAQRLVPTSIDVQVGQLHLNSVTPKNCIRGEADNLEAAFLCCQLALQVRTQETLPEQWADTQHNLGNIYKDRICGEPTDNLIAAIASYKMALQIRSPKESPRKCYQTSVILGSLCFEQKNWTEATFAYEIALVSTEVLYKSSVLLSGKSDELNTNAELPRHLAYTYARSGNLPKAVLTLEQFRGRGLSEILNRDRANLTQLQQIAPNLYIKYQDIANQLRIIESQQRDHMVRGDRHRLTPEVFRSTEPKLRVKLQETIDQIRQIPSYENFLKPPIFADIQETVTSDRPLTYLVTTPNGSMALTVTVHTIEILWLDGLTNEFLQKLLMGSGDIKNLDGGWITDYTLASGNRQAWLNTIDTTTNQLWDVLMGPIVQHLKTLGYDRATLIPTGYLSLLPLHAAWTEDPTTPTGRRYALDDIHFTYTPNACSLTAAREIADRPFTDSILAIDNPRNDLPNSQREIDCAIETFTNRTVLRHEEATIEAVKAGLAEASIVHFSCHGAAYLGGEKIIDQETQEVLKGFTPLDSGLQMCDGNLTLKDLLALNLAKYNGIRLAILSACETALPGLDNIDEVVSLPVGLMQAGVAGVIASLWSVSDLSTMLLLTKFYELWREQHLPADQALRQAQIWLRDSTNDEKVIEFQTAIDNTRMSPATAQQLYNELAWDPKNERSFAHPFHWAAFSYTGI